MNLLQETIEFISKSDRKPSEIVFIGSKYSGYSCTWEEFETLANRDYDNASGGQEVACDLIILFNEGALMWRARYCGEERWEYTAPLKVPTKTKPIKSLFAKRWEDSLYEIHSEI